MEYWFDGRLEESAKVTYLQVDDVWHRLFFKGSVLHWRSSQGPPEPQSGHSGSEDRLVNVAARHALVGSTVASVTHTPSAGGGSLTLDFEACGLITLHADNDRTSVGFVAVD